MASWNYAQVAPTAATIALNAYIFGYGGHSLVTPHAALKQLWWTDQRIEAKVTRAFVVSKLRGEEREFLDRPLAFGEGLTDDTYMEWILERAKRLFLILAEIGVPDQIFGCIDDSWDDDDLPIPLDDVASLELSYDNDDALNQKFYDVQFVYLLRELKRGAHIDYGPKEHIPMDHVHALPPAVCLQSYDRVAFPGRSDEVYLRRKFPLTERNARTSRREAFMRDVRRAKALPHEHIVAVYASYRSEGAGFVLSEFVPEHTLGSFIDHRTPMQLQRVSPYKRPRVLLEWMHCLSDALASLHHRGLPHTQIRPNNIWIDRSNRIAFADVGCLPTFQRGKKAGRTEAYDYAAPEQPTAQHPVTLKSSSPPVSSMNAFGKLRKMSAVSISTASSSTSGSSGGSSSTRSDSLCADYASPITPPASIRSASLSTTRTSLAPSNGPRSPRSVRNFSRHLHITRPSQPTPTGRFSTGDVAAGGVCLPRPSSIDPDTRCDLPAARPEMSDIYSLACVFLDVLTFMLKGKVTDLVKFRSSRLVSPGSSKVRTDSSFHSEPDKIAVWIDILEEDSYRHAHQVFRGIPEILGLLRTMMLQDATLRPTAAVVRDRLQGILLGECGMETLCCAGRAWSDCDVPGDADGSTSSPFRRDEMSIATGVPGSPPERSSDGVRCASACGDDRKSVGMLRRTGNRVSVSNDRRRSSASMVTSRLRSWKSRLLRTG